MYFGRIRSNKAECSMKLASRRRITGAFMSLVKVRSLRLECARVLHELLVVPLLKYGRETI